MGKAHYSLGGASDIPSKQTPPRLDIDRHHLPRAQRVDGNTLAIQMSQRLSLNRDDVEAPIQTCNAVTVLETWCDDLRSCQPACRVVLMVIKCFKKLSVDHQHQHTLDTQIVVRKHCSNRAEAAASESVRKRDASRRTAVTVSFECLDDTSGAAAM